MSLFTMLKRLGTVAITLALPLGAQAQFTAGRLVVAQANAATGAATVTLAEYTTAGVAGITVNLPAAASGSNRQFRINGGSSTEGVLLRSNDSQYLTIAGLDVAAGGTVPGTVAVNNRVIARIDGAGTVSTTTALTDAHNSNSIRSAVSDNGTQFWTTGGNEGMRNAASLGATTSTLVSTTVINLRSAGIYGGQLYYSTSSGTRGVYKVGTGLPTAASTTATIFIPTPTTSSPHGFVLLDRDATVAGVDVAYIVDDGTGSLLKYSYDGANWTLRGSIVQGTTPATYIRNITGVVNGSSADLYITSNAALFSFTDATAFNASLTGTLTSIATAPTGTFRGVAFAPTSPFVPSLSVAQGTTSLPDGGATPYSFGNQPVNTTSSPVPFTLTNTGAGGITVNSITYGGANASNFVSSGTVPTTIANAGSATLNTTFTPSATGARTGTVTINYTNATGTGSYVFNLSGTGTNVANPLIAVSQGATSFPNGGATAYDFGAQQQSTTSIPVTFTISNASPTDALNISGVSTTGNFALSGTAPPAVAANGSATFQLTFTPAATGSRTGTVSITNDSQANNPYVISLAGTGTTPPPTVASSNLTANTLLAGISSPVILTGTNLTGTTLTFAGGTIAGTPAVSSTTVSARLTATTATGSPFSATVTTSTGAASFPLTVTTPPTGYFEPFEAATGPGSYAATAASIAGLTNGAWTIVQGLISSSDTGDRKSNAQSVRLRGGGALETGGAKANGAGTISFLAARYGTDFDGSIGLKVEVARNGGAYSDVSGVITPAMSTIGSSLQQFSVPVNLTGTILVRFTNTSTAGVGVSTNARVNLDNVQISDFAGFGDLTVTTPQNVSGSYNNVTVENGGVATLTGILTVNGILTVKSGGVLAQNCQIITGTGNFDLQAGSELRICDPNGITPTGNPTGAVQLTGTRTYAPGASYTYSGTVTQVTGAGLPGTVRNLTLNNTAGLILSQAVSVTQVASLQNGTLTTNGQGFTLLSDALGTALIVNANGGTVVGAATVQRYIDPSVFAGPAYRHLSAPVSGSNVADLDNTATGGTFSPELSQAAAYNNSATPSTTTPFPTVFFYNQGRVATAVNNYTPFDKGFEVPTSTSIPLAIGRGYVVHTRANEVVDFVGTPTTGDQTLTLSRNATGSVNAPEAGWQLVGNPYPSPLDYSLVNPTGLDAAMYVAESSGPYAGTYRASVNGVGGNGNSGSSLIGSSQGFFVRVSTGQTSGTLTFRNAQRVTTFGTQVSVRRGTADARPLVQLTLAGTTGAADALNAYAEVGTTPGFDAQYDALKLPNTTGLNLAAVAATGEALAIDGRPAFTATTVLPLRVGVPAAGTYTLLAKAINNLPTGLDAFLTDATAGQTVNLSQRPAYSFNVTSAQAAATMTSRFTLHFGARTALTLAPALTAAGVTLYPNPARGRFTVLLPSLGKQVAVRATLVNALGQAVLTRTITLAAAGTTAEFNTRTLAAGIYTLRLVGEGQSLSKRVVVE